MILFYVFNEIGIITFIISGLGVILGTKFELVESKAQYLGGTILTYRIKFSRNLLNIYNIILLILASVIFIFLISDIISNIETYEHLF